MKSNFFAEELIKQLDSDLTPKELADKALKETLEKIRLQTEKLRDLRKFQERKDH